MFRKFRRLIEFWRKSLHDSIEPRPTVYKVGDKKYVKVKRLRTKNNTKGPYLK